MAVTFNSIKKKKNFTIEFMVLYDHCNKKMPSHYIQSCYGRYMSHCTPTNDNKIRYAQVL